MTQKILKLKCKKCGKVTQHYLLGDTYRCIICNTSNKTLKKVKEAVFEPDFDVEPSKEEVTEAIPENNNE